MPSPPPLPPLFGRDKHLIGWQGITVTTADNWNPARFGGNHESGDFRVDDEDGVRMELRWETPKKAPDVEKSVTDFLKRLEKDAKKRKSNWVALEDVKLVSRSRKKKDQLTNFGWENEGQGGAACGYGVAWSCPVCERVLFAQVLGRQGEKPQKIERLAAEVLESLDCHGQGGWETWSAFDVSVQVPVEFGNTRSQLLLNRIEMEWVRPRPLGFLGWGRRAERIVLRRFPIANVLLEHQTLEAWALSNVRWANKQLSLGDPEATEVLGHEGLVYTGKPKDWRSRLAVATMNFLARRKSPPSRVLVWVCPETNRIWVLETELSSVNQHVADDVLESLVCH